MRIGVVCGWLVFIQGIFAFLGRLPKAGIAVLVPVAMLVSTAAPVCEVALAFDAGSVWSHLDLRFFSASVASLAVFALDAVPDTNSTWSNAGLNYSRKSRLSSSFTVFFGKKLK